jgi:hypothetical protein
MASAIGIPASMAAEMGVVTRASARSLTRSSGSVASARGSTRSSGSDETGASTSSSSCSGCSSCNSSSSSSSSTSGGLASGPASPGIEVNASSDEGWMATPVPIPLSRASPVVISGSAVASTSGSGGGQSIGDVIRPWRLDIRQRRLERTLLDARGQLMPQRSE